MSDRFFHRGYTITPHGDRWRTRVRVDGRRVRIARDTAAEVAKALDDFLDQLAPAADVRRAAQDVRAFGAGHLTVLELCDRWYAWKTGPTSDEPIRGATRHDYRYAIDKYVAPAIGSRDAAAITTNELKKDFFRVCPSRTKARFARTVLRQAFRWAIEEQIVARRDNPVADILIVRRENYDGRNRKAISLRAVTDDEIPLAAEIQKMLAWALEKRHDRWLTDWWLWLYVDGRLGLRPSECSALKREDLDSSNQLVRVRRSVPDPHDITDWYPKTETSVRDLEVDQRFFEDIEPFLPPDGWLFPSRHHSARIPTWGAWTPSRKFARMRRELGLSDRYHPYSLRQFVATRLILAGEEDIQVAKFLGTSVEMLHKTYANHLDRDAQRKIGATVMDIF
jgi:integrase